MARSAYTVIPQSESDVEKAAALLAAEHDHPQRSRTHGTCSIFFLFRLCRVLLGRLLAVLTPSFLQRQHHVPGRSTGDHQHSTTSLPQDGSNASDGPSTAWLDGLRGVASFGVFLFHHSRFGHPNIKIAYGGSPEQHNILQLPILRLLVHGRTMVSVFFIVSGYALSFSALKLIRQRDHAGLARRLSSSVFRRAIRLMLPSFVAGFLHYLAQRAGLVQAWNHESSFLGDTAAFMAEFAGLMDPFTWTTEVPYLFYGPQLWTIPVEFRASMFLFVTLLGLARAVTGVRLAVVAFLGVYAMARRQWDVSLFMAGIMLADVNLTAHHRGGTAAIAGSGGTQAYRPSGPTRRLLKKISLVTLLLFGLYLASYPTQKAHATNVYIWLSRIGPAEDTDFRSRVYTSVGAALSVTAISFLPACQRALERPLARYMGRISYALYLTHPLLNILVGRPLARMMWGVLGATRDDEDWVAYEGAWLLATALYLPVVVWVADVFWRVVDLRAVEFAKSVERWCTVS
ncbi:acyltransferase family-domain-containing protein [Microdochium bolleyi]|uniref:Acyltransferase family-domain-containing protein n=1 Tax=Microdochium bolleyi TaxID=196109 RepID=A0A136IVE6_9PEZI|nr:acyltransferase family-domain-containing protein [Microdochium bolleyi]